MINPNTSVPMTEGIGAAARAVAAPGTEILARCPCFGRVSIEGHFDDAFGAAGVAEQAMLAAPERFDAAGVACFGDPGLDAAREAMSGPVLALEHCGEDTVAQIEAAARAALAKDRSEAIVLGCAGMAALGLETPKGGDYAPPLPRRWTGWAPGFGR